MDRRELVRGQPLKIFRMNPGTEARTVGTIAVCTRGQVSAGTALSWLMLQMPELTPLENVGRFFIEGNILTQQRNTALTEMQGDWILFVDGDMTFAPDALRRLLQTQQDTDADMVGALCFQRGEPYQPTLYYWSEEGQGYTFREKWNPGEVLEVDATGMAFMLITTRALRKIIADQTTLMTAQGNGGIIASRDIVDWQDVEWPSVEERRRHPANFMQWQGDWGEDFGFCRLAKAAGCKIVVDTGVEIGHLATVTLTQKHFLQEIALRDDDAYAARRDAIAPMGLEAMTQGEALRRLGFNVTSETNE